MSQKTDKNQPTDNESHIRDLLQKIQYYMFYLNIFDKSKNDKDVVTIVGHLPLTSGNDPGC